MTSSCSGSTTSELLRRFLPAAPVAILDVGGGPGLRREVEDAGLRLDGLFGIEGPGWLLWDRWDDPRDRRSILRVARTVEQELHHLNVSIRRAQRLHPLAAVVRRIDGGH